MMHCFMQPYLHQPSRRWGFVATYLFFAMDDPNHRWLQTQNSGKIRLYIIKTNTILHVSFLFMWNQNQWRASNSHNLHMSLIPTLPFFGSYVTSKGGWQMGMRNTFLTVTLTISISSGHYCSNCFPEHLLTPRLERKATIMYLINNRQWFGSRGPKRIV